MSRTELIIVDPQIDFCDPNGALSVAGADKDMERLAVMIDKIGKTISQIHVTLDSHHLLHVANPLYWKDKDGNHPDPFTIITLQDVKDSKWGTFLPQCRQSALNYLEQLEKSGRYPLCIWPPHCLIGSPGHAVFPVLYDALCRWESSKPWVINFVSKGSNVNTEHYSAVKAEVPDPNDPTTQINSRLINILENADTLLISGEAGSHCVANTVRDIANAFKNDDCIKKMVLLEDSTSPVTGFENLQNDFIEEMKYRGVKISKTTDF